MESSKFDREFVEKVWGVEEVIVNTHKYCGKLMWLKPGYQSSLHYHDIKDETFLCIEGSVWLEWLTPQGEYKTTLLTKHNRSAFRLMPGTPHRFWAAYDEPALVVEFSTAHNDNDVTRLEESKKIQ
jgi:D-lyxose ketol-isomerase